MAPQSADPQIDRHSLSASGHAFEISKAATFEAAHRLPGRGPGDPYGRIHGHSFRIEATVAGRVQPGQEWVEDLATIDTALKALVAKLDHQLLNDIPGLEHPTLERIALWAAKELSPALPGLSAVTLERPSLDEVCRLKLR